MSCDQAQRMRILYKIEGGELQKWKLNKVKKVTKSIIIIHQHSSVGLTPSYSRCAAIVYYESRIIYMAHRSTLLYHM